MNVNELKSAIRELNPTAKISGLRKADLESTLEALRAERSEALKAHYAPKAAWRIRCATGFNVSVHKTETTWLVEMNGRTLWSNVRLDRLVAEVESRPEAAARWVLTALCI